MKQGLFARILIMGLTAAILCSCSTEAPQSQPSIQELSSATNETAQQPETAQPEMATMQIEVNGKVFDATLADTDAARALAEHLAQGPITIEARDYSGFEKVGDLGFSLPASNVQMTTQPGDIMLYNGNQIVAFYGSNSWSYTMLAHVDDLTGWREALGNDNAAIMLTAK